MLSELAPAPTRDRLAHPTPLSGTRTSLIPTPVAYAAVGAGICLVWAASIWISTHLHADPLLHRLALFGHLASLLAGFGAVLTLDWLGALWLLGKRSLPQVVDVAEDAHLMIWVGLAGLIATGCLLEPQLHRLTWVKLGAVLVVALNGLHAHHLQGVLKRVVEGPGKGLLIRVTLTAAISQAAWWTACAIGYCNRG